MTICLDSDCVIYLVEGSSEFGQKIRDRVKAATEAGDALAVCDLAIAECLIGPLKTGDADVHSDYLEFFSSSRVRMLSITPAVCERAAEVRAKSPVKINLPDALHIAKAIEHGCERFLTNDKRLARYLDFTVESISKWRRPIDAGV